MTEVQDAHYQTGRVSDQARGLVCHDRSKRCVFPCLHPSSTQEVPEVCFRGRSLPISGSSVRPCTLTPNFHKVCGCCSGSTATPGHPHTKLYRRLVDSSSIRAYGGSTSRCCSRPYERVGVKTKRQEKCAFSITEDHLGVVWDSTTMQAKLSPARIESILTAVARLKEGQSITVKQFQRLLGLMAAASNVIPFGLLYMRPLQGWLKTKGVFPESKSVSHDQGHTAMLSCLWHVEETLVLVNGVASSLSSRNVNDRCVPHRLRCGHEWPPCPRSVERPPSHVAHQLPRDAGCVSSVKTLSPRPKRLPCGGAHRQHSGGLLYQPPGRSAFAPLVQAGAPDPCVGPRETPFNQSSSHPWVSQSGSRLPVETGAEARGMETPPRGGVSDLENVWPGSGGLVCDSVDIALSPLVLSDSSSSDSSRSCSFSSILQSRVPSTRKLYALKWKLITSWCRDRQLDPVNWFSASVLAGSVLCSVDPLHPEGVRGGYSCLPCPSRWPVCGKTPPGYTFSSAVRWGLLYDLMFLHGIWPWSWRLSANLCLNLLRRFQIKFWDLRLSSC